MQTIKVAASTETKHSKDGSKTFYAVKDATGAEFTTYAPELLNAKPGDTIESEVKINGKFLNLVDGFKIIPAVQPAPPAPSAQTIPAGQAVQPVRTYGRSPEELAIERRSIERQTSLKLAIEYFQSSFGINNEATDTLVLDVADRFYQWISGTYKKAPETTGQVSGQPKQNTSPPSVKVESSDEVFQKLESAGTPTLPEFKTADEMLRFACNKASMEGLGLRPWTWGKIQETLAIKAPVDIRDMKAAAKVLFAKESK